MTLYWFVQLFLLVAPRARRSLPPGSQAAWAIEYLERVAATVPPHDVFAAEYVLARAQAARGRPGGPTATLPPPPWTPGAIHRWFDDNAPRDDGDGQAWVVVDPKERGDGGPPPPPPPPDNEEEPEHGSTRADVADVEKSTS